MKYETVVDGKFVSRQNRFVAQVEIAGKIETVHVKNTGRCKELLMEGATVFLEKSKNPNRKTKYDLIAVYKGDMLINMDAQAPNRVFYEWAKTGIPNLTHIKGEVTHGDSRFDFYMEADGKKCFVEIKGVTLEENGVVLFPDAPTERGIKHLNGLAKCVEEGNNAMVVFVVQMEQAAYFTPNEKMHPAFADALRAAKAAGVAVRAFTCRVCPNSLEIADEINVKL